MPNDVTPQSDALANDVAVLSLAAEALVVGKRTHASIVQVRRETLTRDAHVDEALQSTDIVVERVPQDRFVDAIPPVREEGDVTILPVVEEVLVIERRLRLTEEVHIRRVRSVHPHSETVVLREQRVVVTRSDPVALQPGPAPAGPLPQPKRTSPMSETIVAVYDSAATAEQAVQDLLAANVPQSAISRHTAEGSYTAGSTTMTQHETAEEGGFWSSLFGGHSGDHDTYDRSLASGGNVVSVTTVPEHDYQSVMAILERHGPVDIDERTASYGTAAPMAGATGFTATRSTTATGASVGQYAGAATTGETLELKEEQLAIGKRLVNRGGTRVRRYVVETPVEEQVTLRDERVELQRRAVADGRPATDADFSERTIEMMETAEEAVVSKNARIVEEVALNKVAGERVETVRDTLRREDVQVEQVAGGTVTERDRTVIDPKSRI